jgi:hypothetical protein
LEDWAVVKSMLPEGWQQSARTLGAFGRVRQVKSPEMLLRVLLVHLAEGCSLQETAARVQELGWVDGLTPQAVALRLQSAEQWLRWMAEKLWAGRVPQPTGNTYRVRAVDATVVRESGRTGSQWRVHYAIGLRDLQCDFFELTDVHGGETLRRIPIRRGDLLLGDRVYGAPPGIAHVTRAGGAVLVRVSLQILPLFDRKGQRMKLRERLKRLRIGAVWEVPAYVHGPHDERIAGRLIALRRGRHATRAVLKRLKRKHQKNQTTPSKLALEAARYLLIWTSVPAEQLSARAVLEIYRLRWQIELAFKRAKSIMGLGQLPKRTAPSSRAWLHGKLLVALLIEKLIHAAESFSPWGYELETQA